MVTRTIVSRFQGTLPFSDDHREIADGPLYPREEVLALVQKPETGITLWSEKCRKDVVKLDFDTSNVAVLIAQALETGTFLGSEWCTSKPNGPWAACDAYAIRRSEWNAYAHKELDCPYYVKFCIGKTGAVLLVASCHLQETRRTK